MCNPFLHLRDPSEELADLGFSFTLLITRYFPPGTFSTETFALLSFESWVIYSRDSRDTFNIVKLSIMHWKIPGRLADFSELNFFCCWQQLDSVYRLFNSITWWALNTRSWVLRCLYRGLDLMKQFVNSKYLETCSSVRKYN